MKPWKLLPLEHDDFATRLREENGRGTAGWTAPDDGYVVFELHEGPHVTPPRQVAKRRLREAGNQETRKDLERGKVENRGKIWKAGRGIKRSECWKSRERIWAGDCVAFEEFVVFFPGFLASCFNLSP